MGISSHPQRKGQWTGSDARALVNREPLLQAEWAIREPLAPRSTPIQHGVRARARHDESDRSWASAASDQRLGQLQPKPARAHDDPVGDKARRKVLTGVVQGQSTRAADGLEVGAPTTKCGGDRGPRSHGKTCPRGAADVARRATGSGRTGRSDREHGTRKERQRDPHSPPRRPRHCSCPSVLVHRQPT